MLIWLRNTPVTFRRTVGIILSTVRRQFALVYIDDILVFSNTLQDFAGNVQTLLGLFRNARVSLK